MHHVALARQAIEAYLATGHSMLSPTPIPEEMAEPGAVFVSLHLASGELRGCRGTITPTEPTLAEAIIKTAISSATDDPRFPPMMLAEMEGLKVKVDVLGPMEPVSDVSELDEKVYGLLIQSGHRRAVLLPDIDVVKNVPHQLELIRRKAGLAPDEPADLYRFTVTRYK